MKRNLFILMLAILLVSACAPAASTATNAPSAGGGAAAPEMPKSAVGAPPPVAEAYQAGQPATTANQAQERLVIQNADLTVVVKDPQAKMLEIGAMAKRLGGFVVSSNMTQVNLDNNTKVPQGDISIRIPAANLDAALAEIKANTVDVPTENRSGQDVTDKYVDLQSQLKAKQAAADKLYEILQQANNATDTLAIFNQLSQVQSDIEVLKGQIKFYEQSASLSAISVRLLAEESIQPLVIGGWKPVGVARDAVQALINFFQSFVNFLIWLVIFVLPVAAVVIVLLALLWRLLRWFWRKVFPRKAGPAANPPVKPE